MKSFKKLIIILLTGVLSWYCYELWQDQNLINPNEVKNYELSLGESFTLKLYANGSLGFTNCLLNTVECVKLHETNYESNYKSRMGYIESGGWTYMKFKAIKTGKDSILIHFCPVKDVIDETPSGCDNFKNKIKTPDYKIYVTVKE